MDCKRLEALIKSWYFQVQDEALAPARMVDFMEKHISSCEVCIADEVVRRELKRIIEIVLPPSKAKKKPASDDGDDGPNDEVVVDPTADDSEVEEDDLSVDAEDV